MSQILNMGKRRAIASCPYYYLNETLLRLRWLDKLNMHKGEGLRKPELIRVYSHTVAQLMFSALQF